MGNFCSVPVLFRMRHEEQEEESSEERGHLDLITQLSYDIYKIQGDPDSRDDLEEKRFNRRPSKRYYGVSKSAISRLHSQQHSTMPSFGSSSSAGTASTSNWTRSQQPSSTELALEDLVRTQQMHAETSSSSSRASSSSSDTLETNQSERSPRADLPIERTLEESVQMEESH